MPIKTGKRTGKNARSGPASPEHRLNSKKMSIRLNKDIFAKLEAMRVEFGMSRSSFIAALVLAASLRRAGNGEGNAT